MENMEKESHPAAATAAGGKIKMAKGKRRTTSKLPGAQLDDEAQTNMGMTKCLATTCYLSAEKLQC